MLPQLSHRRLLQRRLLGCHGWLLLTVGTIAVSAACWGQVAGSGPFAYLHANRVAAVGFIEAYGLAALLGIGLRLAATADHLRRWHILAALIHASWNLLAKRAASAPSLATPWAISSSRFGVSMP